MKMTLLTAALVVALGLQSVTVSAQQNENKRESVSRHEISIDRAEDGHKYRVRVEDKKIVELIVDDKKIDEADYPKYEPMIRKILEQAEEDRKRAAVHRAEAEVHRAEAEQHRVQAQKDREQAEVHRKQAELDRQEAGKHREEAEVHRKQAELDRARAAKDREQAGRDREQAEKDRARAEIDRKKAAEDRKQIEGMLDEVVSEKLIENRDALKSLTLDDKELTVNDVKQPDAVHAKFKTKYLKTGQNRIRYSNSGSFRGISIDR